MDGWILAGLILIGIIVILLVCGAFAVYYRELEIKNRFWRALVSGVLFMMEVFLSLIH
ncbi:hypothetical protein JZO70_10135 [Enterococcus sp. 669A]|uniref:Uncharacterized protein n=1 Tax=Candidatus Enterococcus moelleringii TaxID=2815325 RepID=A0ABS3LA62_9ENTE|nr:hypothetical protein [Enterococcus sp. 669A]MBO1306522.1 hypothetical protein [Enterococcus sp. 669A]